MRLGRTTRLRSNDSLSNAPSLPLVLMRVRVAPFSRDSTFTFLLSTLPVALLSPLLPFYVPISRTLSPHLTLYIYTVNAPGLVSSRKHLVSREVRRHQCRMLRRRERREAAQPQPCELLLQGVDLDPLHDSGLCVYGKASEFRLNGLEFRIR